MRTDATSTSGGECAVYFTKGGYVRATLNIRDTGVFRYGGATSVTFGSASKGVWYKFVIELDLDNLKFNFRIYDASRNLLYSYTNIEMSSVSVEYADVMMYSSMALVGLSYWDEFFSRKWVDPEPSHGSWGSEETPAVAYTITLTKSLGLKDSTVKASSVVKRELPELQDMSNTSMSKSIVELLSFPYILNKNAFVSITTSLNIFCITTFVSILLHQNILKLQELYTRKTEILKEEKMSTKEFFTKLVEFFGKEYTNFQDYLIKMIEPVIKAYINVQDVLSKLFVGLVFEIFSLFKTFFKYPIKSTYEMLVLPSQETNKFYKISVETLLSSGSISALVKIFLPVLMSLVDEYYTVLNRLVLELLYFTSLFLREVQYLMTFGETLHVIGFCSILKACIQTLFEPFHLMGIHSVSASYFRSFSEILRTVETKVLGLTSKLQEMFYSIETSRISSCLRHIEYLTLADALEKTAHRVSIVLLTFLMRIGKRALKPVLEFPTLSEQHVLQSTKSLIQSLSLVSESSKHFISLLVETLMTQVSHLKHFIPYLQEAFSLQDIHLIHVTVHLFQTLALLPTQLIRHAFFLIEALSVQAVNVLHFTQYLQEILPLKFENLMHFSLYLQEELSLQFWHQPYLARYLQEALLLLSKQVLTIFAKEKETLQVQEQITLRRMLPFLILNERLIILEKMFMPPIELIAFARLLLRPSYLAYLKWSSHYITTVRTKYWAYLTLRSQYFIRVVKKIYQALTKRESNE
jgi:hypothetical protein